MIRWTKENLTLALAVLALLVLLGSLLIPPRAPQTPPAQAVQQEQAIPPVSAAAGSDTYPPQPTPQVQKLPVPVEPPSAILPEKKGEETSKKPGKMVIIIDDMGMDRKRSARAITMDSALTLSFLPYAPNIQEQVDKAKAAGHEIMLHLPMEAMDPDHDAGPDALTTSLTLEEFDAAVERNLSRFTGYVGVNNHMGSMLTSDPATMEALMPHLAKRNLFFIDSRTAPNAIAYEIAGDAGLLRAEREVFLDHYDGAEFVIKSLAHAESLARRKGIVVVIGHPRQPTLDVLERWIPAAKARGLEIIPASRAVHH